MLQENYKSGDQLILHSENGLDYKINIISFNPFREPGMEYAIDLIDINGVSYYESYGDVAFVGHDFINKCMYLGCED